MYISIDVRSTAADPEGSDPACFMDSLTSASNLVLMSMKMLRKCMKKASKMEENRCPEGSGRLPVAPGRQFGAEMAPKIAKRSPKRHQEEPQEAPRWPLRRQDGPRERPRSRQMQPRWRSSLHVGTFWDQFSVIWDGLGCQDAK